jgi:hypothetical protein
MRTPGLSFGVAGLLVSRAFIFLILFFFFFRERKEGRERGFLS